MSFNGKDEEQGRGATEIDGLTNQEFLLVEEQACAEKTVVTPVDRCILAMFCVYLFLVALLFTWPRYATRDYHGDGLGAIAIVMSIVLEIGLVMMIVSLTALIVTIRNWNVLATPIKMAGLGPLICSIVIIVVVAILAEVHKVPVDDPWCIDGYTSDGELCPTSKNETGKY